MRTPVPYISFYWWTSSFGGLLLLTSFCYRIVLGQAESRGPSWDWHLGREEIGWMATGGRQSSLEDCFLPVRESREMERVPMRE